MLNFHPGYGFADETRLMILRDAEIVGVKEAARIHNVSTTVIYKWRRAITQGGKNETIAQSEQPHPLAAGGDAP